MNEIVPAHTIGDYVPLVDGPEKASGPRQIHCRFHRAGNARWPYFPQPLLARGNPRRRCLQSGEAPGCKGDRHRRGLRQRVWRPSNRAHRTSTGARQSALLRRAACCSRSNRRGDGERSRASDRTEGSSATGLSHRSCGDGAQCGRTAQTPAEEYRARCFL